MYPISVLLMKAHSQLPTPLLQYDYSCLAYPVLPVDLIRYAEVYKLQDGSILYFVKVREGIDIVIIKDIIMKESRVEAYATRLMLSPVNKPSIYKMTLLITPYTYKPTTDYVSNDFNEAREIIKSLIRTIPQTHELYLKLSEALAMLDKAEEFEKRLLEEKLKEEEEYTTEEEGEYCEETEMEEYEEYEEDDDC